jgi:hypothetical protein
VQERTRVGDVIGPGSSADAHVGVELVVHRVGGPHRGINAGGGQCVADGADVGAVEAMGDGHQPGGEPLDGQRPCCGVRAAPLPELALPARNLAPAITGAPWSVLIVVINGERPLRRIEK